MRTVREDIPAQDAFDDACEQWTRTEEAWEALKWALTRDPYIGVPLTEGGQARSLTLEGKWAFDMPTITVLYEVELHHITIKSALFDHAAHSGRTQ